MTTLTRRKFLGASGRTAAGLALATCWPRLARANPAWGDLPPGTITTPADLKVLQIHLLGGVAPFESFYYRDSPGRRTRGFDAEIAALVWNAGCGSTPAGLETMTPDFGNDANGKQIKLGPFAKPLWGRSRLVAARRGQRRHPLQRIPCAWSVRMVTDWLARSHGVRAM